MSARTRGAGEGGQVTAFVTVFTVALVFVVGLVLDGGLVLAAKRQAGNVAESAARAGAQAVSIDRLRSEGASELDPDEALARARSYLARVGHRGTVTVSGDTVTATVEIDQPLQILGIGGLGQVTVTGRGEARTVRGVERGET